MKMSIIFLLYRSRQTLNVQEAEVTDQLLTQCYLSPTFWLLNGPNIHRELRQSLQVYRGCEVRKGSSLWKSILALVFGDPIFLLLLLLLIFFICYTLWLPPWRQSAYDSGLNSTLGFNDMGQAVARIAACSYTRYQECLPCNQYLLWNTNSTRAGIDNLTIYDNNNGCGNVKSIDCPSVSIAAANYSYLHNLNLYVTPVTNETYLEYLYISLWGWEVYTCNRTIQALSASHNATVVWICLMILIIDIILLMAVCYGISQYQEMRNAKKAYTVVDS